MRRRNEVQHGICMNFENVPRSQTQKAHVVEFYLYETSRIRISMDPGSRIVIFLVFEIWEDMGSDC